MSGRSHLGSFRDPAGFVFDHEGTILRQVNRTYRRHFDRLIDSGLFGALVQDGLLVAHREVSLDLASRPEAYKVLAPQRVPFVSYPYEWSFSQLQDAALATCEIQLRALAHGMTLKDASAFNIQFIDGRPTLIDTLSFEVYEDGRPWVAYRQFCEQFLAPLALMSRRGLELGRLLQVHLDGVPLDLAARLLPLRARARPGLLMHLFAQAWAKRRATAALDQAVDRGRKISRSGSENLVRHLASTVRGLRWRAGPTAWSDYREGDESYQPSALARKKALVAEFAERVNPASAWDLGANTGTFARLVNERAPGCFTIAWDADPACVDVAYKDARARADTRVLPLVVDLANPSPALGWHHQERLSFVDRGPADLVLALALMHHLVLTHYVPLERLAGLLGGVSRWLVIEFVPQSDPKARLLAERRSDVWSYSQESFDAAFGEYFVVHRAEALPECERVLYLMERRS